MKKIILSMVFVLMTITTQAQGKLLSSIEESYSNGYKEILYAENFDYDANNNYTRETNFSWLNILAGWKKESYEVIYTYNSNNKVVEIFYPKVITFKDPDTGVTEYRKDRELYNYANGKFSERVDQEYISSKWETTNKFTLTYNNSGLPSVRTFFYWDGGQWVLDARDTFTYNANNKLITYLEQYWENSQWNNDLKTTYTHNTNNKRIASQKFEWNDLNNTWVLDDSEINQYNWDSNGNQTEHIITNKFNNVDFTIKLEYIYDTTQLMRNYANPFIDATGVGAIFDVYPYVNKLLTRNVYAFNNDTKTYELTDRIIYNYSSAISLGTDNREKADNYIAIYPNPTSSIVNLDVPNQTIDKVTITDITGKKVLEQTQNTTQINVESLAKGTYIIEVSSENKKFQSKFIKE